MSALSGLADRLDVADLFARLAHLVDEGRHEDASAVYHPDAVVRSPHGELHGLDEVIAHLARGWKQDERTQHVHGDVLVDIEGDRATATANQVAYFHRGDGPPHRTDGLRLACTAARTPAGWRFDTMRISLAWVDER